MQRSLERSLAIPAESDADACARPALLMRVSATARRALFLVDLSVMVLENALFTFFVVGMDSGLAAAGSAALPNPNVWVS